MYSKIVILASIVWTSAFAGPETTTTHEQRAEMLNSSLWTEDYAKALKLSQVTGKPLLLAFVGSDWCPWSARMEGEILSKIEFAAALKEQMILVWVDFPEKTPLSLEKKTQNMGLKNRFAVQELPTLVLIDSSGDEIIKLGYLPLAPHEMAGQLKNAFSDYKQLRNIVGSPRLISLDGEELQKLYRKASVLGREQDRRSVLEVGLKKDKTSFFLMRQYEQLIEENKLKDPEVQKLRKQILSSDPSNAYGIPLQLAIAEFNALSRKLKRKESPNKAIMPLVEYLKMYGNKDLENRWRVEMMIAQFLYSKNYLNEALGHAKNSYETAPEQYKAEAAQSLEFLASKINTSSKK